MSECDMPLKIFLKKILYLFFGVGFIAMGVWHLSNYQWIWNHASKVFVLGAPFVIFLGSATLIMLFPNWFGFILRRIATVTQTTDYLAIYQPIWLRPAIIMGLFLALILACAGIIWDMFIVHSNRLFFYAMCEVLSIFVFFQMVLFLINTTPRKKRFLVLEVSNTAIRYCCNELLPGTGFILDKSSVFPVIFIWGQWKIPHRKKEKEKVKRITQIIGSAMCFPVEPDEIRQRIERTGLLMSPEARAEWEREREV
ncbi:hypothetical protein [Corynebacterium sp. sy039]|uniref:hypothetical protein n=1 Tax=Corynebacterium sp. sy039 TaxID=2599641 RepID=UPI0011B7E8ED|nr:hypothetical protein [Corynebacterium sp. sy039]QDZ42965.1 hypothetical protein FQV43_07155 [Corynebacterium sp. sy039]